MSVAHYKPCPKCYFDNPLSVAECEFCGWQLLDEQGEETLFMGEPLAEDLPTAPEQDSTKWLSGDATLLTPETGNRATAVTQPEAELPTRHSTQFQQYLQKHSASAQQPAQAHSFNLAGDLAHFAVQQIIGKGGMGAVYKAVDETLERNVAIKVLRPYRGLDQAGKDLLLAEARTICKLGHPNIVTVYDIARGKDNNFIIMEWIEGETLDKLIPPQGLTLDTALNYAHQIVQGLVHAHQHQIIHSDIKPQNIMLTGDAGIKILDFSISGLMQKHTLPLQDEPDHKTFSAGFNGTPGYMSPEQALGKKQLDERSDIFAFGILFYQLLTGQRPFAGKTAKEKNAAIITGDYPALPQHIPQDIRAIAEHCLALSPKDRYQTSEALLADFNRYLSGNPVSVIDSKSYWLKKKSIKHKWPVLLIILATFGGIGQLSWQQIQAGQQAQREQLLTRFTRQVENLEANVQLTRMSPAHDTSASQQAWQASIAGIAAQIPQLGDIARGPGNYAIGRMYYVLQNYDLALNHLQLAWQAEFREDRVAYYLALTHSALYQQQYAIIQNLDSSSARTDRLQKLNKQHKQPAVAYLQQGMRNSPFQAYAQALLSFYQGQNQQALTMLDKLSDVPAWFYEHHILRGDILLHQADSLSGEGDQAASDKAAQEALQNYIKAQELGRSDFLVQLKPLSVINQKITNALYGDGEGIPELLKQAKAYLHQAQIIAPNDYRVFFSQGQVLSLQSDYEKWFVGDPLTTQEAMIQAFEQAQKLSPGNANVLLRLGLSYAKKLGALNERDLAEPELLKKATDAFNAIPRDERDYFYYNSIGIFLSEQALFDTEKSSTHSKLTEEYETEKTFASPLFKTAEKAFNQARHLKPQRLGAAINLGALYRDWATELPPELANDKLFAAKEIFSTTLEGNPEHFVVHYYLGASYRTLARNQNFLLQNNQQSLQLARQHLNKAEQLQPNHPYVANELMIWFVDYAEFLWQLGENPSHTLAEGITYAESALRQHPDNTLIAHNNNFLWLRIQMMRHFAPQFDMPQHHKVDLAKSGTTPPPILDVFPDLLAGKITETQPNKLMSSEFPGDYNLVMAEYLSLAGDYAQSEQRYLQVRDEHMNKALHLLLQRQNYQRWQSSLVDKQDSDSQPLHNNVSEKLASVERLLQQHFPRLWQHILTHKKEIKT